MARRRHVRARRLPVWFVGLLVAVVVFAVTLFLLDFFGYGDDPVIDQGASALARLIDGRAEAGLAFLASSGDNAMTGAIGRRALEAVMGGV